MNWPKSKDTRLVEAIEEIARTLKRMAPIEVASTQREPPLPNLGITVVDNEEIVRREMAEESRQESRGEKVIKEYKEFEAWRERNGK